MYVLSASHQVKRKATNLVSKFFSAEVCTSSNLVSHYMYLLDYSPNPRHLCHLHARLIRSSLYCNVILSSKLVFAYSRLNRLVPDSLSVFFHMPHRNIYSWNIIIGEFCRSSFPGKSIELFLQMRRESEARPDDFTLPLVLRACASSKDVNLASSVHGLCLKLGLVASLFVVSSLVFMYVNLGRIFVARMLFDEMPVRDSVLWTAMFGGYVQLGEPMLGIEMFREMAANGVNLDWVAMVSLLLACGQLGWLKHGKAIHGWCSRRCLNRDLNLSNAIIDMYVKCSMLGYAQKVFDKMPERDVISWSSIILGYGLTGDVETSLSLFEAMLKEKIRPNSVTFLGVLSACTHGGLVDQSRKYFKLMEEQRIVPELKHYASMVDCFSRAGRLEEAEKFLDAMPLKPDSAVLGAVLSGCRVYGNVEIGERVARKLIELEPERAGYYVTLADLYSMAGRRDEAESIRELMREKNISKVPGCSVI